MIFTPELPAEIAAIYKALLRLSVPLTNGTGFNQADEQLGCQLASQIRKGEHLSPYQIRESLRMCEPQSCALRQAGIELPRPAALDKVLEPIEVFHARDRWEERLQALIDLEVTA